VDSIKFSFNEAYKYAQSLQGWLLLQGGFGSGKTHLAAAIANHAVSLGVPTIFQTVPDLLEKLRSAYGEPGVSFQDRLDQIQSVQLLILDDFGTQNATGWAQEKLFQIINYRYINRLSTVVTTNLSLDEIEGRIRSRLQDVELVKRISISAPDYRRDPQNQTDELSSLHLLKNKTFANFLLRRNEKLDSDDKVSLQEALQVAQTYSKHPEGWVVFTGDYGSGKTHLAAAIGHECKTNGLSVLFMEVPTLLDYLRSTFNPNSVISFDNQFNKIRTSPLLILDDFGTHSATPWAREKLYQIFNHRYNAQLPTVITISADELENVDPRIDTRMKDPRLCLIVSITAPPFHSATKRGVKKRYQQS